MKNTMLAIALITLFAAPLFAAEPDNVKRGPAEPKTEFGVFINSNAMRAMTAEQVAPLVREIGLDTVSVSNAGRFVEEIKIYRDAGIRVGSVYVGLTTDGTTTTCNVPFETVLSELKGTDAIVMLHLHAAKGATVTDEQFVELLTPMAERAKASGVQIAIYAHVGFTIEQFNHAVKIADGVDRPNFGVCFTLCHTMKKEGGANIETDLRAAGKRLKLAVINGSAVGDTQTMGWNRLIQPLNQGEYDLAGLMKLLDEIRFTGPVHVQCYAIPGTTREVLQATYDGWQEVK